MATKLLIQGLVQGVGFRPLVCQIARENNWAGRVLNCGDGVEIVVANKQIATELLALIKQALPSCAAINQVYYEQIIENQALAKPFAICQSTVTKLGDTSRVQMPQDQAICAACVRELFDPSSRFFLYPFISCTHCGPRYSIIENMPYDRPNTTMSQFPLCQRCQQDYNNINSRRYHAQTIACVQCGPKLSQGLEQIIAAIQASQIIALKGIGGYSLIADACNAQAIERLRQRKQRPDKPFAILALNQASIMPWIQADEAGLQALNSNQRPIVLFNKYNHGKKFAKVADGFAQLGFLLPQTALHYLLFYYLLGCPSNNSWLEQFCDYYLVLSSANVSGGPIITNAQQAEQQLQTIADLLIHDDRRVTQACDDSVLSADQQVCRPVRLAKGYTPSYQSLNLDKKVPRTLALGSELKNTISMLDAQRLIVSPHIGDLQNLETTQRFEQTIASLQTTFGFKPEIISADYHPDGVTRQVAETMGLPFYPVYHHHAHAAAVMAEFGLNKPCIALVLDGFGYGLAGESWGGELLECSAINFEHLGHIQKVALPGGDQVVKTPWKMAVSLLSELNLPWPQHLKVMPQAQALQQLLRQDYFAKTSSLGRLFDAISAYLGLCDVASFEGQAAMQLEAQVQNLSEGCLWDLFGFYSNKELVTIVAGSNQMVLNLFDCLHYVLSNETLSVAEKATAFHQHLIAALAAWVHQAAQYRGLNTVVLAGGCFLNRFLYHYLSVLLRRQGLKVYIAHRYPINDAAISIGQAWVAAHQHFQERG